MVEVSPWLSSLRSFAVEGVAWFFIRYWLACPPGLLCLWTPGIDHLSQVRRCSSSVPNRSVASPPLVGFAFVFSAVPLPQAAAVGFGLCGSARLSSLLLFSGLVERGAFHCVPSPLSSFGMWSPFGVISVFCHY